VREDTSVGMPVGVALAHTDHSHPRMDGVENCGVENREP